MLLLGNYSWNAAAGPAGVWSPPEGARGSIDLASPAQIAAARPGQPRGVGIFLCDDVPRDWQGAVLSAEDAREARPGGAVRDAWESLTGYRPAGEVLVDWLWDHFISGSDPEGLDGVKPFVPTAEGSIELWLGDRICSERFAWGRHRLTPKLKALLQRDLTALRAAVFETGGPPADRHLKVADALCEKFAGCDPRAKAELFAQLKPAGWQPDEGLVPHATTIGENFDGADSGTLGHQLAWTQIAGTWTNTANQARISTTGTAARMARADSDLSSPDMFAQADTSIGTGTFRDVSVFCRKDATGAQTAYMAMWENGNGAYDKLYIEKVAGGGLTALGAAGVSITPGAPNTLKVSANGSTIAIFHNGTQKDVATDTAISSGLRAGLWALNTFTTSPAFDNFQAGDLVAPGGVRFNPGLGARLDNRNGLGAGLGG